MFVSQAAASTQPPTGASTPVAGTHQASTHRDPPVFNEKLQRSLQKTQQQQELFFRPRTSILDYTELMWGGSDKIRGFVTCFWTIAGAYLVSVLVSHFENNGEFLSTSLGGVIFSRSLELVLGDLALVLSTTFVVPFTRLLWLSTRLDSRNAWAMLAHAATEISWLLFWYSWLMGRGWPWVQRCFFVLHIVVNWMKMHSYLSTNRMLAGMLRTRTELAKKKDSATADLDMALNKTTVSFPASVTLANYVMFQLSPTLVYELEYPRTKSIRWGYVLEKILGTMGIFFVFYIVVAHLVLPRLEKMPEAGVLVTTVHLMGPMATCWLLFFFITFDSIANGFAELTRFADRRFYDDWWNARGLDEFSRKWNRPVHMFLARHVYMPIRQNWRGAVPASVAAMGLTFLFSSVLHEVTLTVACSRWNHGLFFIFQMMQVPVIVFSEKVAWFKDCQAMRNWFFWVAMVIGQPYLLCMYTYGAFATKSVSIYQQSSSPSVQANGTNAGM